MRRVEQREDFFLTQRLRIFSFNAGQSAGTASERGLRSRFQQIAGRIFQSAGLNPMAGSGFVAFVRFACGA